MPQPEIIQIQSEFQDVVEALRAMTRDKEMAYRLGVGQYILQRFYGGSAAAFSSKDPKKADSFSAFAQQHADDLAEFELGETQLRRCVRVHLCYQLLPPSTRDSLSWSALLHLSTLDEVNQRAQIAAAAVAQRWSVAQRADPLPHRSTYILDAYHAPGDSRRPKSPSQTTRPRRRSIAQKIKR